MQVVKLKAASSMTQLAIKEIPVLNEELCLPRLSNNFD